LWVVETTESFIRVYSGGSGESQVDYTTNKCRFNE
jgi:hypothetical protein